MRDPRNWNTLLILPEADVAFAPLPLPGVEVEVKDGRNLIITGDDYIYRFHIPGLGGVNEAVDWVNNNLAQRGFNDPEWVTNEALRVFFAVNTSNTTPSYLGGVVSLVESKHGEGAIVIVENLEFPTTKVDAENSWKHMFKSTLLLIRPFEYPDDAIVHAHLLSQSNELDLEFELPAGTVPRHYAFGMIQTERVGRYVSSGECRFIADGIIARNGDETRHLAEEIASDPGVRDARVRMVDSEVAEITGRIIDKRKKESILRCRMIPAEEGVGLLIATLTLSGEEDKESKKLLATATETVDTQGEKPRPIPDDVPENAIDALMVIDSFRQRKISKKK